MKKIFLLFGLLLILAVAGCQVENQMPSTRTETAQGDTPVDTVSAPADTETLKNDQAQAKEYSITISNFAFSSPTFNINVGDTITWTNQDSATHTVTSNAGNELDSDVLGKAQSYSHTFDKSGIYEYHCTKHPSMKADVVVGLITTT